MAERFKEKLRAREKLTEAQLFLENLKRNMNQLDMFQRYLSAFMAAWRSVTSVLQKDIKRTLTGAPRENRDELMKWYDKEVQDLRALPHAKALLDLRNVLLKEGSRLPVYQFVLLDFTDEFPTLEISYDASTSQFTKIGLQINPAVVPRRGAGIRLPRRMTVEEAKSWLEENQEKVREETLKTLVPQLVERLASAIKLVTEKKRRPEGYIRLIIDDSGTTMTIDEFITLLESRTNSLERFVAEAEKQIFDPQTTSPTP